jgi:hypothetical protein
MLLTLRGDASTVHQKYHALPTLKLLDCSSLHTVEMLQILLHAEWAI